MDRLRRRLTIALALLLGGVCGLAAVLWWNRQPLPSLTTTELASARARWDQATLLNYDIEIRVSGRQAATYRVEVRDGMPRAAWRNDKPLRQTRTWATWSVPGMFSTMAVDLRTNDRARQEQNDPPLLVRAAFHAVYGYPEQYQRLELKAYGSNPEVSWEVTRFQLADPVDSPAAPR